MHPVPPLLAYSLSLRSEMHKEPEVAGLYSSRAHPLPCPPHPAPPQHPLRSLPRKAKIVTINRNPVSLALNSGEPRAKHILSYRVESIVFVMITLAALCI